MTDYEYRIALAQLKKDQLNGYARRKAAKHAKVQKEISQLDEQLEAMQRREEITFNNNSPGIVSRTSPVVTNSPGRPTLISPFQQWEEQVFVPNPCTSSHLSPPRSFLSL